MAFKQVFETGLTDVWTTALDGDPIGDLRWEQGKCYKCVELKNVTGTVAVVAGSVLNYLADTGYALNQVVGDVDDAGTQRIGAGVALASAAGVLATSYYLWVQIKGIATVTTAIGGSAGDGDPLTTDGAADLAMDKAATIESRWATCNDFSDLDIICDFPF